MRETHIKMCRLITALHDGKTLNAEATKAAISYARKLTTDSALQEFVRREFKRDLAERDIKRANHVVANKTAPGVRVAPVEKAAEQTPDTAKLDVESIPSPAELGEVSKRQPSVMRDYGLTDARGNWTDKGKAWGKLHREKATATPANTLPVAHLEPPKSYGEQPAKVEPLKLQAQGWGDTEDAFLATEKYYREFGAMPPVEFNLEAYWKGQAQ